ncbi:hypothetical protein B296_00005862 [Ensete ventricosum]|uniref:Uncharacterized protein n=1 Tax=Ensete ventricosum TaxID=4639 RepID=A0A427A6Q8_ENSVE|nr:hypothetical protein B296_00005862 [Ensete ventricosum]
MCKCFTDKSYLGGGYSYAGNKLVWSLVISSLFIVVSSFSALSCVILGYLNGEIIAKNYFSYTMTWFYLLICDIMQTHKKKSNRSPNHVLPSLPDEAIQLAVVEHLPYRTSHVVCISWLSTLYQSIENKQIYISIDEVSVVHLFQVSNPSIQFMIYETLLKKIKRKRASNTKGAEGLTALEVDLYHI